MALSAEQFEVLGSDLKGSRQRRKQQTLNKCKMWLSKVMTIDRVIASVSLFRLKYTVLHTIWGTILNNVQYIWYDYILI